jgi:hypothetical protein
MNQNAVDLDRHKKQNVLIWIGITDDISKHETWIWYFTSLKQVDDKQVNACVPEEQSVLPHYLATEAESCAFKHRARQHVFINIPRVNLEGNRN